MKVFLCLSVVLLLATYVNSYSYQQQQQSYSQPSYNSKSQSYNNKKPSYSQQQEYLACPGGKEIITSPGGGLPGSCTSNTQCTMSCNAACAKSTYESYGNSKSTYDYARFGYCVQKQENKENNKYHSNGYQKQSYSKRSTSGGYQRQHTTTACKCCCDNYPTCPTSLFNYQLNTTSCNNYMDCTNACNQVSYCGVQNPTACVFTNLVGTCQCCCQPCQTISNPSASPTNLLSSTNPQVVDNVWIMQGELYPAATATSAQTTSYTYTFCSPLPVQVSFTDLNCPSQTYLITVDGSSTRAACTNCLRNCGAAAVTDPETAFGTAAFAKASIGPLAAGVTHTVVVTYPTPATGAPSHSEGSAIRFTVLSGQLCPGNPVCPN